MPSEKNSENGIEELRGLGLIEEPLAAYAKRGPGSKRSEEALRIGSFIRNFTTKEMLSQSKNEKITEESVALSIRIGIEYLDGRLRGSREEFTESELERDSLEVCVAQLWNWIHYGSLMEDGGRVNELLVKSLLKRELDQIRIELGDEVFHKRQFLLASEILGRAITAKQIPDLPTAIVNQNIAKIRKPKLQS